MSTWLTRKQAAAYIKARISTGSVSLLAKLARTNEGPRCFTAGKAALYDPADLDQWITSRLRPMGSSPEPEPVAEDIRPAEALHIPLERPPIQDEVQAAFALLRDLGISP